MMFATPDDAERANHEALSQADLTRLMQVWADDETVSCIHPGSSLLTGLAAVHASWKQIFSIGPIHVRPQTPLVIPGHMCEIHVLMEEITVRTLGGIQIKLCYTTNVYRQGPRGWNMIMHHSSLAPDEAAMPDQPDIPDLLH